MATTGNPELKARLRTLWAANWATKYANDPAPLAARINAKLAALGYVQNIIEERFKSGGAMSPTVWAPLKPATVKQRARLGFGPAPILVRSGALRQAATGGKCKATADGITLEFKDGPAPHYSGGGKNKWQSVNAKARAANKFFGAFIGKSGSLSDYAGALHKRRPFYAPPTDAELAPLAAQRDEMIQAICQSFLDGHGAERALAKY